MTNTHEIIFELLKGSITGMNCFQHFEQLSKSDWNQLYILTQQQGLVSVVIEAISSLPRQFLPPQRLRFEWIGQTLYREKIYQQQYRISCKFADALAKEGVKCLVLKGLALASFYPKPQLREFGDLDCYLIASQDSRVHLSNSLGIMFQEVFNFGNDVAKKLGGKIKDAGYKHVHIHLDGLLIENHKYLTNFNETKQGVKIEKILRQLALDGGEKRIGVTNLWIPSPEFNVIFLLKHALDDFIANDMPLRALYDWTVFMNAEQENIDWKKMSFLLDECKLRNFFELMTETCRTYFGLNIHADGLLITTHRKMVDDMIHDVLNKPTVNSGNLTMSRKIPNILGRFKRQYKYRKIETESVGTLIWNTVVFSSLLRRKVSLE